MNETTTETSSTVVDSSESIEPIEVFTEEVTDETIVYDEYGFEVTTTGTELQVICSQMSELNSYVSVVSDNTLAIRSRIELETILMFVIIAFCGMVCGLLIANCIRK